MRAPGAWLEARLADAPSALRDGLAAQRAALDAQRSEDAAAVGTVMRAWAEELLAQAASGPPTRDTALTLLAADALMTLACEWAAEHEPGTHEESR